MGTGRSDGGEENRVRVERLPSVCVCEPRRLAASACPHTSHSRASRVTGPPHLLPDPLMVTLILMSRERADLSFFLPFTFASLFFLSFYFLPFSTPFAPPFTSSPSLLLSLHFLSFPLLLSPPLPDPPLPPIPRCLMTPQQRKNRKSK